jgi:hypothetical protein
MDEEWDLAITKITACEVMFYQEVDFRCELPLVEREQKTRRRASQLLAE